MEIKNSTKTIGSEFGDLFEGVWISSKGECEVASKTVTSGDPYSKMKFLQEAVFLAQFNHPNIIRLCGIITESDDNGMTLIFDLPHCQDLKTHLNELKTQ